MSKKKVNGSNPHDGHPCRVCGKRDPDKAMCFRFTPYCCGNHEKIWNAAANGRVVPELFRTAMRATPTLES